MVAAAKRTVASRTESSVDLKMANHSLAQVIEQLEGVLDPAAGTQPTYSDVMRLLGPVLGQLQLVSRTIEGVSKRGER